MARGLRQAVLAEFLGTAMLLCAVIGSGIMGERLAGGNMAVALLVNTLATVFALFVLVETLGPFSGAHFNPVVTLSLGLMGKGPDGGAKAVGAFVVAQLLGAMAGAWLANAMFDMQVLQWSSKLRGGWTAAGGFAGWGQWLGEFVATAGLLFVILAAPAGRGSALVAAYIGAAYWFTSSTSFANPAAVFGRMFSDSFAGIAPASAPGFVLAQCLGAACAVLLWRISFCPKGGPS